MNKKVSIVIPTFNRPNTIKDIILSYLNQKYVFEIIIVDDCSEKSYDEFNSYMRNECKKRNIIYKYVKNDRKLGAAGARNRAIEEVDGNYILWGEDDLCLSSNYTEVLLSKITDKTIYFGSIYYGISNTNIENDIADIRKKICLTNEEIFNYKTLECNYKTKLKDDISVPFGHAIILVPYEVYKKVKYFQGYKVNGYREETDAQILMLQNGYDIMYTSDTECYHLGHKYIEKGGQHSDSKIKWELYTLINNYKFLNRHYKFLKNKYNLKYGINYMKLYYLYYRIDVNFTNLINKIKRSIK